MSSYAKAKGRSSSSSRFVGIPLQVTTHPNFRRLSGNATKLLVFIVSQYNGYNNGNLSATWKLAKDWGFRSESTLFECRRELLHYGMITISRYGGKNMPTLYALTWKLINECRVRLDVSSTKDPTGEWKQTINDYISKSKRIK